MSADVTSIFIEFLKRKHLNFTTQREEILSIFLKTKKHLSIDELHHIARKKDPSIGHTTVFRTLKLLCAADIAREVNLEYKVVRYELKFGHQHHDHLVCTKCGSFIEAMDPDIEKLQDKLCKKSGFLAERHKMEIYGICKKCRK